MWFVVACVPDPVVEDAPWEWDLPEGFPEPEVPAENPMTVGRVAAGRALFFDRRLSGNGTQSCGDCHDPALAFTDGKAGAVGSTEEVNRRGSMSLVNSAWFTTYTWADDTLLTLEEQALVPLTGTAPVEMAFDDAALDDLAADPETAALLAVPWPDGAISLPRIADALASFQRSLVAASTPYDRFRYGEETALDESEQRGMDLYNSEILLCYRCHGGYAMSESVQHADPEPDVRLFRNTGLYDLDGAGAYPASDQGLIEGTGSPLDMGRFRAPTLRNIALTAPYMHDGSVATLDDVLTHYAAGGRAQLETGTRSPLVDPLVAGFPLSDTDRTDLLAFLATLTDATFLEREDIGPP